VTAGQEADKGDGVKIARPKQGPSSYALFHYIAWLEILPLSPTSILLPQNDHIAVFQMRDGGILIMTSILANVFLASFLHISSISAAIICRPLNGYIFEYPDILCTDPTAFPEVLISFGRLWDAKYWQILLVLEA